MTPPLSLLDVSSLPLSPAFERAALFHGHVCPGLAIGYRVVRSLWQRWGEIRAEDEELVAVVENDACGVDAIQALLGCTLGKGNLIFLDHGKQVFSLFSRRRQAGWRLALRPRSLTPSAASSPQEKQQRRLDQLRHLLATPENVLFQIQPTKELPPPLARRLPSLLCAHCGEEVMETRLLSQQERLLCIPCARSLGVKT